MTRNKLYILICNDKQIGKSNSIKYMIDRATKTQGSSYVLNTVTKEKVLMYYGASKKPIEKHEF